MDEIGMAIGIEKYSDKTPNCIIHHNFDMTDKQIML